MKHDFLTRMREIFAHFLSKLNEDTCHYINGPETLPPPLTKAEEQVIFQNIRDGKPNARDPLITHNLRLVVYIAKKFESPAVNVEDLISIGTIGLIKAVNTFSVERNIKLATYASRCIENEILMYLRKTAQLKNEISLDDPLNVDWDGNELLLSDLLGSDPDIVNRGIEQESEKQTLLRAVEKLDPREKQIMELRFGDNFFYQVELEDALREIPTVSFWLQPLAENFFTHGFNRESMYNLLIISGHAQGPDTVIEIMDNGSGVPADQLEQVQKTMREGNDDPEADIGLRNVYMRLNYFYGNGFKMEIGNNPEGGFKISILIPGKVEEDVHIGDRG